MALPPISGQAIPPQTQPTRSVADARAAQRAFFEAALGKVQAPAAATRPSPAVAAPAVPAPARPAPILASNPPPEINTNRPLRPGSLVNIVV